jgi:ATP-dependent 26S proteasome regulatory subunit
MNIDEDLDFDVLVSSTQNRTGADIKSICTEAGMFAIRESRVSVSQEDFRKAISKVQSRGAGEHAPSGIYA